MLGFCKRFEIQLLFWIISPVSSAVTDTNNGEVLLWRFTLSFAKFHVEAIQLTFATFITSKSYLYRWKVATLIWKPTESKLRKSGDRERRLRPDREQCRPIPDYPHTTGLATLRCLTPVSCILLWVQVNFILTPSTIICNNLFQIQDYLRTYQPLLKFSWIAENRHFFEHANVHLISLHRYVSSGVGIIFFEVCNFYSLNLLVKFILCAFLL